MKIAVDIRHLTHPALSGVGLTTLQLLRVLSRIAVHDEFFLFASGTAATLERLPTLPRDRCHLVTRHIPNRALFAALKTGATTLERLLPVQPDCWWFPDANIIRTALPYVLTVHDLSPDIFPAFFTRKDRLRNAIAGTPRLARNATRIHAVSESTKQDLLLRWQCNPAITDVAHLGVGAQYTPHRAPSDQNYQRGYGLTRPYLLFLATQEPRKNITSVIEAYDAYRMSGAHAPRLVIAGGAGWKTRAVQQAYRAAAHRNDIVFVGYVHEKHKPALYRGALAFLFPSFYEGFGLPVLEAMACGTPVVTSMTSSLPEVGGEAVLLVDPLNVSDLQSALHQLLDAPDAPALRALLGNRGAERARRFTWDQAGKMLLTTLHASVPTPRVTPDASHKPGVE